MSPARLGKNPRDDEPRFAVPATGLFHLAKISCCIGAHQPASMVVALPTATFSRDPGIFGR